MQSISMVPFLSLCFNRQMAGRALVHLCGLLRCAGGVTVRPKMPPNMRTRLATSVFTNLQQSSNYASASDHRQRPCGHIQSIFAHRLDACPSTPFYQHLCIQALPTSQRESLPPPRATFERSRHTRKLVLCTHRSLDQLLSLHVIPSERCVSLLDLVSRK